MRRPALAAVMLVMLAGSGAVIDYLTDRTKIDRLWSEADSRGYAPYASQRDLDRLVIPAGHAPVCRQTQ